MKEEYITTPVEDVLVYEYSEPTNIPKGKTPVRGLGLSGRGKIYDKVVFIDTELLSGKKDPSHIIEGLVKQCGKYQEMLRFEERFLMTSLTDESYINLQIECNVFNIEENKWEGWGVRKDN